MGHQAGDPGRADTIVQVSRPCVGRIFFCSGEVSPVLLRPLNDWMRPTHIRESNLRYSMSSNLNVNLIQNTLTETWRIMFDHTSRHHGPAKLTYKINHYSTPSSCFSSEIQTRYQMSITTYLHCFEGTSSSPTPDGIHHLFL